MAELTLALDIGGTKIAAGLVDQNGTLVASEDELRTVWSDPGRRTAFIQRLVELGLEPDAAMARVQSSRSRTITQPEQRAFVRAWAGIPRINGDVSNG